MSNSVRPQRRQPTRISCPWDSSGKNTGVGCYFLLQCIKVKSEREVSQSCLTLSDPMDYSLPGSSMGFSRQEYWSGLPLPSPSLFLEVTNCTVHPQHVLLFSSFSWPLISWNSLEKLAPSLIFTAGSFSAAQLELNS